MAKSKERDPRSVSATDRQIGMRIRARRAELGVSQTTLAEAIGVTFQQVQKYERGVNRVSASTLNHVAKVLKMPVAQFFGQEIEDNGASALDDPACREVLSIVPRLSADGRKALATIARGLAAEDRFKNKPGKR
jgi:transcriptional regulator with XRE-family HTH domain